MSFSMSIHWVDAVMVVALIGAVDSSFARELQDRLLTLLDGHRPRKRVIVDVSRVNWIHPQGISSIVAAYWHVTSLGEEFGLVASQPGMRDTLLLAKLDWFAPIYRTLPEAIRDGAEEI